MRNPINKFDIVKNYYLYFMMYAIIGWVYEVFLEVVVYGWGFTNRGVLFGPYCPVYGFGALAFILVLRRFLKKRGMAAKCLEILLIGIGCMAIATTLELATSYVLEATRGSWPWQGYSRYMFNFQGRIALNPSVRFGIGGIFCLYLLQPVFEKCVIWMDTRGNLKTVIFAVVLILFAADFLHMMFM